MEAFIDTLFSDPQLLRMGHAQRLEDKNLGLGWMYYALGRIFRPAKTVVIGSYRGYVPAIMAKSMIDNLENGELIFIDPSLADDFWSNPDDVQAHFNGLGINNLTHHKYTTQDFIHTQAYAELDDIGMLMVDGYHTAEQARFDYLAFLEKLNENNVVLFHDSTRQRKGNIYGKDKAYEHTVNLFMDRLKETPGLEVFTLPVASGVSIVRGRPESLALINQTF